MKRRAARVLRRTRETDIRLNLVLDGNGEGRIVTGIGFFDHMLELFAKHSGMDLSLTAKGDLNVDQHHTVEDAGICLGEALRSALGRKEGITRYGFCSIPMDEALVSVAVDLSGRPHLRYAVRVGKRRIDNFDPDLVEEFFRAIANAGGLTLHIDMISGKNAHHIVEAVFKAVGRAIAMAVNRTGRGKGIPSTKGML